MTRKALGRAPRSCPLPASPRPARRRCGPAGPPRTPFCPSGPAATARCSGLATGTSAGPGKPLPRQPPPARASRSGATYLERRSVPADLRLSPSATATAERNDPDAAAGGGHLLCPPTPDSWPMAARAGGGSANQRRPGEVGGVEESRRELEVGCRAPWLAGQNAASRAPAGSAPGPGRCAASPAPLAHPGPTAAAAQTSAVQIRRL
ncbi:Hypothetical predicted protein [Marmota monax]|uniref:Uncharacterized protein n=1 Tax=Marmota monax TaxID=9995 RepID=A0A5E4A9J1_MARMO|nr:hypothetical protein GHT09_015553 [Marmota monax]VTJ53719.1 Hypothetical predicted protein [Marmota monax]